MQLELELKDPLQKEFKGSIKNYILDYHWKHDVSNDPDLDKLINNYTETIKKDVIKHMLDRTVLYDAFYDLCSLLKKYDEQFKWCSTEGILNDWTHRKLFDEFNAIKENTFKLLTSHRSELKDKLLTDANNEIALLKKEINEAYEVYENFKKIVKIDSKKKLILAYEDIIEQINIESPINDRSTKNAISNHYISKIKLLEKEIDNPKSIEPFMDRLKYLDDIMRYIHNG